MKKTAATAITILIVIYFLASCREKEEQPKESYKATYSTYGSDSASKGPEGKQQILYGLLTPTEIASIFSRMGIKYNEDILNPVENNKRYTSTAKASLNLGIYGVDFGYIKMFGLGQNMIEYMLTIKLIANNLGIPDQLLTTPLKKMQDDMSDPDTIMRLVNKSYDDIDKLLRKDGRESTAGLMLMGGYVEALYIVTQLLYDPENPDRDVVEKIAQQKYTLNTLLGFMRNYYDDPVVVYYTKKLIFLKRYFDTFDIYFRIGDLKIDTTNKLLEASGCDMTISPETLMKIRDYVRKLRNEMVTP